MKHTTFPIDTQASELLAFSHACERDALRLRMMAVDLAYDPLKAISGPMVERARELEHIASDARAALDGCEASLRSVNEWRAEQTDPDHWLKEAAQ